MYMKGSKEFAELLLRLLGSKWKRLELDEEEREEVLGQVHLYKSGTWAKSYWNKQARQHMKPTSGRDRRNLKSIG